MGEFQSRSLRLFLEEMFNEIVVRVKPFKLSTLGLSISLPLSSHLFIFSPPVFSFPSSIYLSIYLYMNICMSISHYLFLSLSLSLSLPFSHSLFHSLSLSFLLHLSLSLHLSLPSPSQTRVLVAESIRRNIEMTEMSHTDADSDAGLPDDSDDLDDEMEVREEIKKWIGDSASLEL